LPSSPREQLGSQLRDLRLEAGLSGDALAAASGGLISQSRVSRIENGRTLPTLQVLQEWLRLTNAPNPEEVTELWQQVATEAVSWGHFRQGQKQQDIAALERESTRIQVFQPVVIPGLLQTAEYAKQVMGMAYAGTNPKMIAARMERQAVLYDEGKRFDFLITEGALSWHPPGMDMRPQLDRITAVASLPNVTIQVVPFEASMVFLNMFIIWDDQLATTETYTTVLELRETADLARLREVWERLSESAVDGLSWLRDR
jgi:transcriptional regulator with XRE-family HTH domain